MLFDESSSAHEEDSGSEQSVTREVIEDSGSEQSVTREDIEDSGSEQSVTREDIEDSGSEQSVTREDIERDKSSDFHDLSNENILRTPRKNRKRRIWQVNNDSGEESSAHESYDSSDVHSSEEDTRVLIKSPQKKKHSAIDEPLCDSDGPGNPDAPHQEDCELHETLIGCGGSESDWSDNLSEDPESAPESTSSIEHPSSEEEGAEDEDTESEGDMNSGESGELPLYDGSTLTSANFDALLLALFKKHRMSEAAKEDMLKLLELTLPGNNSVAPSYKFNKRHDECLLPYKLMELCPTCHKKVEKDLCKNSDCGGEGMKVEVLRFYEIPLKPQLQRLLQGKNKNVKCIFNRKSMVRHTLLS